MEHPGLFPQIPLSVLCLPHHLIHPPQNSYRSSQYCHQRSTWQDGTQNHQRAVDSNEALEAITIDCATKNTSTNFIWNLTPLFWSEMGKTSPNLLYLTNSAPDISMKLMTAQTILVSPVCTNIWSDFKNHNIKFYIGSYPAYTKHKRNENGETDWVHHVHVCCLVPLLNHLQYTNFPPIVCAESSITTSTSIWGAYKNSRSGETTQTLPKIAVKQIPKRQTCCNLLQKIHLALIWIVLTHQINT